MSGIVCRMSISRTGVEMGRARVVLNLKGDWCTSSIISRKR